MSKEIKTINYKKLENLNIYLVEANNFTSDLGFLEEISKFVYYENLVKETFQESLITREKEFPTAFQGVVGVALPHAEQSHILESSLVVIIPNKPIPFKDMLTKSKVVDVSLIFLLLAKETEVHLNLLSKLSDFIQNKNKMKNLLANKDFEIIVNSF